VPSASNPTNRFMQGPLHGHIESATFVFSMYIHWETCHRLEYGSWVSSSYSGSLVMGI